MNVQVDYLIINSFIKKSYLVNINIDTIIGIHWFIEKF